MPTWMRSFSNTCNRTLLPCFYFHLSASFSISFIPPSLSRGEDTPVNTWTSKPSDSTSIRNNNFWSPAGVDPFAHYTNILPLVITLALHFFFSQASLELFVLFPAHHFVFYHDFLHIFFSCIFALSTLFIDLVFTLWILVQLPFLARGKLVNKTKVKYIVSIVSRDFSGDCSIHGCHEHTLRYGLEGLAQS